MGSQALRRSSRNRKWLEGPVLLLFWLYFVLIFHSFFLVSWYEVLLFDLLESMCSLIHLFFSFLQAMSRTPRPLLNICYNCWTLFCTVCKSL
jgi:hypothetical protein